MPFDIDHAEIRDAVTRALTEDIGTGDLTTNATIPPTLRAIGHFRAKQQLTLAGVELLNLLFDEVEIVTPSGTHVDTGDTLAKVKAPARDLLTRERVALNFLQRLSGIATLAQAYAGAIAGTGVTLLDTRKTTPGLRRLEKQAAQAGGVTNHRMGLFDAVLIKNNHIALAGGVTAAIERAQSATTLPIEVEVRTREEIEEALALQVDRILLDNMTPRQAALEVRYINGRARTEISGGVTLSTVRAYADARPDFISVGAITHSATAVDINLTIHAA